MKKSSKFLSLLLAVLMAVSCFTGLATVTASAAEETKVYFEVPTLEEWGTTKTVYCHIYTVYGHMGEPLKSYSWGSKGEKCSKDATTGLYYFDTSKLGTIEEDADYALLFHTVDTNKGVHQTCNVTFSKECLGDYVYLTGGMVENTEDSTKLDYEATWKNHSDKYGAKAAITSTAKVIGKFFPAHQPKAQIVSQALRSWAVKNAQHFTPEAVQGICEKIGAEPMDVYNMYAGDYAAELEDPEANPETASLETVATLLGISFDEPTTEPTEAPTTEAPTTEPTEAPTEAPTTEPTEAPTTEAPTTEPTEAPTTEAPTTEPTEAPTTEPVPTEVPTEAPTTEPVTEFTAIVAGVESLCGSNWSADDMNNAMAENADGVYEITYPEVAAGDYQFKVVANGEWIGKDGNNVAFTVTDTCDVTITFNKDTQEITVTGDFVVDTKFEVEAMRTVGNGFGAWLNDVNWDPADDSNKMTEVSTGVYEIVYEGVEADDNYQVKFAANGNWNDNWGGVYVESGVETDAVYNAQDNITVSVPYETAKVTIKLDLSAFDYATKTGAKFTITVEDTSAPAGPLYGDVNGDGEVNVADATEIQKAGIGLVELTAEQAILADVNQDGRVSILDTTMIQKYSVGMAGTGVAGQVYTG